MIRIKRPDQMPASLKRLGERQIQRDCDAYDASPDDYHSGKVIFPKREYYSAEAVKDILVKMHHSKCCYCEKKFRSRRNLHVEHFRPKGGFRQALSQKKDELPGYYWLAYLWENLLLSCDDCNSKYKHTFFPLTNPAKRARSHHDDVTMERPLFIDPVRQDPRKHIGFDGDDPVEPRGKTRQGRATIDILRLGRKELKDDRRDLLDLIETYYAFLELAAKCPKIPELCAKAEEARRRIKAATQPEAEFSSMVRDYVAKLPLFQPNSRSTKAAPSAVRSSHPRKS